MLGITERARVVGFTPHESGAGCGKPRCLYRCHDMVGRGVFRLGRRLDFLILVLAQVFKTLADPLHVLLDATRDVAETDSVVGPTNMEKSGEFNRLQAENSLGAVGPLVLSR